MPKVAVELGAADHVVALSAMPNVAMQSLRRIGKSVGAAP